jgi:hypothetical protein
MPVEIKELHIRVSVVEPSPGTPAGAPSPPSGAGADVREAIVAECVEHVLQVLADREER